MGQSEVMDVLEKYDKPITCRQIAKDLDVEPTKVFKTLAKLLKLKDIKCIEMDRYQTAKMLGLKIHRRTRFYYL